MVIKKYFEKLMYYDIFRIRHWYYYVGFPILGRVIKDPSKEVFIYEAIISIFILAFIYSFNDYVDRDEERKYFLIPLIFLSPSLFLMKQIQLFFVFSIVILQTIYSSEPFRLKRFPVVGTLCCALTFPQLFLLGYTYNGKLDWMGIGIFLLLVILVGIAQLFHEINDISEDKYENIKTTAVILGKKKSEKLCLGLIFLSITFSILLFSFNMLKTIPLVAILSFLVFGGSRIIITGITYKTWMYFRGIGCLAGIIWYISILKIY